MTDKENKNVDDDGPTCKLCLKKFEHRSSLSRHVKAAHSQSIFACSKCQKTFKRKDSRDKHEATTLRCQQEKVETYQCCERIFRNKSSWTRHTKRKTCSRSMTSPSAAAVEKNRTTPMASTFGTTDTLGPPTSPAFDCKTNDGSEVKIEVKSGYVNIPDFSEYEEEEAVAESPHFTSAKKDILYGVGDTFVFDRFGIYS